MLKKVAALSGPKIFRLWQGTGKTEKDTHMKTDMLEEIALELDRRHILKKKVNLILSVLIVLVGIPPFVYWLQIENFQAMAMRYLTIDGTLLAIVGALAFVGVNIVEILNKTELTSKAVYYFRLTCATTEALIMTVILLGYLPFFEEPIGANTWDDLLIHVAVPVLVMTSFIINDAPIGRISIQKKARSLVLVVLYGIIVLPCIFAGIIPQDKIPYPFFDTTKISIGVLLLVLVIIVGITIAIASVLVFLNRKVSWLWYYKVGKKK